MFETLSFWVLLILTAAAFYLTHREQVRIRAVVLILASVASLVYIIKLSPLCITLLLVTSVWTLVGLRLTRNFARSRPFVASALVFLPTLIPWILGKQAFALGWKPLSVLYFVGFSFYLIKSWTLIKDHHDDRIRNFDGFVALAYLLFFPAYVAGPMHYYNEFDETLRTPSSLTGESCVDVLLRLLCGLAKIKLIAALFMPVSLEAIKTSGRVSLHGLALGSLAYSVVIWADFSGYSDLAISTSRLLGIRTPENFNYPYAAANIREFWQRWHITFSRVLTAYLFIPISRKLQNTFGDRRAPVLTVAYLATFLFCGYWHGPTLNFLLWGLYHGLGLIVYDWYRQLMAGSLRSRAQVRPSYTGQIRRAASIVLTVIFVSFGWILFVLPTEMIFRRMPR